MNRIQIIRRSASEYQVTKTIERNGSDTTLKIRCLVDRDAETFKILGLEQNTTNWTENPVRYEKGLTTNEILVMYQLIKAANDLQKRLFARSN